MTPLPPGHRPRIVLVEDDPSIRRFMVMALEDLAVQLIECDTVNGGLEAFRAGPVALLITDLNLPGASGMDLLRELFADAALRGEARIAVCSAGVGPEGLAELAAMGVRRILPKPCSLSVLEACVLEALEAHADAATTTGPGAAPDGAPTTADARARAVAQHFEGDDSLYDAFSASCAERFPEDIRSGDAACQRRDLSALRHVVHSLKSVLLLLGHEAESEVARQAERAAAAGELAALDHWAALRERLAQVIHTA
ncbi:response regulator [Ideonella sp. DXS29W]|uniref:Response regulator n=1 Tax=Ideonella lacteola TaxID=2984193 RepID=A0ABU9BXV0_9BURK